MIPLRPVPVSDHVYARPERCFGPGRLVQRALDPDGRLDPGALGLDAERNRA